MSACVTRATDIPLPPAVCGSESRKRVSSLVQSEGECSFDNSKCVRGNPDPELDSGNVWGLPLPSQQGACNWPVSDTASASFRASGH